MKVELLKCDDASVLELIARVAISTRENELVKDWEEKTTPEEFIRRLKKMKHFGVLEHITFTFYVSKISRNLTHQLVRHRLASYLQMSSRRAKPRGGAYVCPPSIEKVSQKQYDDNRLVAQYEHAMEDMHEVYTCMIEEGVPIEDARYLLPSGYFTHITLTMNCRNLRHLFELRCDMQAQWEIRKMADEMLKICYEKFPVIFEDLYKQYIKKDAKK